MKALRVFIMVMLLVMVIATPSEAGILKKVVQNYVLPSLLDIIALAISAVVGLVALKFGFMFGKVMKTFKETGEFMAILGTALEDKKITREEITAIVKEGKDIFAVWI